MLTLTVCSCLTASLLLQPADRSIEGVWELTHYDGMELGNYEANFWIIDLRMNDGKLKGKIVAASSFEKGSTIEEIQWEKGRLRIKFTPNDSHKRRKICEFDGVLAEKAEDGILGCLQFESRIRPAQMKPTKKTKIENFGGGRRTLEPLQPAYEKLHQLRNPKVKFPTKEAAAKAANELVDTATPMLEEVLQKHPTNFAAVEAAEFLVRQGVARELPLKRIEPWAKAGEAASRRYGPRFHAEYAVRLASVFAVSKETAPLILELISAAEKSLDESHSPDLHYRTLWLKDAALRAADDMKAATALDAQWNKLDAQLLERYREKRPLPKLAKFDGKVPDNGRVAVVEWLTIRQFDSLGNSAEAALDGLAATFPPDKLLLIEYAFDGRKQSPHGDAIGFNRFMSYQARWKPDDRVENPFFVNGVYQKRLRHYDVKRDALYDTLKTQVDAVLSKPADVKLKGKVTRREDKLTIHATVEGVPKPGENHMRVLLLESHVHYAVPAGLITQKRVVRVSRGVGLKEKDVEHSIEIDLAELDRELTLTYVGLAPREVLNPLATCINLVRQRRLIGPHVMILVENPGYGEILQALRLEVPSS